MPVMIAFREPEELSKSPLPFSQKTLEWANQNKNIYRKKSRH